MTTNEDRMKRARHDRKHTSERGFVMVMTMLIVLVISSLVTAAVVVGSNHLLAHRYYERQSVLETSADAGLELARARINGDPLVYPDSGYSVLESGAPVRDGDGVVIPGVQRWLYAGPTGVTSGQYGFFGSVVSVVRDDGGGAAIRRSQINQESFAKFAYFTDIEPTNISFGGGDVIFGPVHSNSELKIYSSGATFHGDVRTAKWVQGGGYGTFAQGYEEYVAPIPMPATADLTKLQAQAAAGETSFMGDSNGLMGEATTRIEFMALDLNGDGDKTDPDEGFFRVYRSPNSDWVVGNVTTTTERVRVGKRWRTVMTTDMLTSQNCGWTDGIGVFRVAARFPPATAQAGLESATRRCYLGGSDELNGGFVQTDANGAWVPWTGDRHPGLSGRADAGFLFPLSRAYNPGFKGVIYVQGKVAISGEVRGQVTVAASDDIVLADDLVYATDPGAGTCQDIMGIFSGDKVVISDNTLNAPVSPAPGSAIRTYDDTKDEFFHGVILALDIFTVENYGTGARIEEPCEARLWGRGCIYLTGGIIQKIRGAVGTSAGTGGLKRYAYDPCAATSPPPYFPTTGHFVKGQYYHVDPTNFSVAAYYAQLTPG